MNKNAPLQIDTLTQIPSNIYQKIRIYAFLITLPFYKAGELEVHKHTGIGNTALFALSLRSITPKTLRYYELNTSQTERE